jgi:hypothetical protein
MYRHHPTSVTFPARICCTTGRAREESWKLFCIFQWSSHISTYICYGNIIFCYWQTFCRTLCTSPKFERCLLPPSSGKHLRNFGELLTYYVRFKVLKAVTILMTFFWMTAPCGLVGCCLNLQGWRWAEHTSPKRCLLPTTPHGDLSKRTSSEYWQTTRRNNPEDSHLQFIINFN